jgi:hypothetical protein
LSLCAAITLLMAINVARAADDASSAKTIASFLDEQAFLVVRFDSRHADPAALHNWISDRLRTGLAKDDPQAQQANAAAEDLAMPRKEAEKFLRDFHAAGGQDIFVIVSAADIMGQNPPAVVVPLRAGADAEKLSSMFDMMMPVPIAPAGVVQAKANLATRMGDALVITATDSVRERIRSVQEGKVKRAENTELLSALSADAPGDLRIALAPPPGVRKVFEELLPTLPPQLGGGPSTQLTQGLRWAYLDVKLPPQPVLRVVVQSTDAQAAESLGKVIDKAIAGGVKELEAGQDDNQRVTRRKNALAGLLPKFAPKPQGDRLVLAKQEQELNEMSGVMVISLIQARTSAKRVQSISNIRQQLMVGLMYSSDHKGEWPDDLSAQFKKYDASPVVAINPQDPKSGYTYLKPSPGAVKAASSRIVVYESTPNEEYRGVGFLDGHAEIMLEEQFKKALQVQQAKDQEEEKK